MPVWITHDHINSLASDAGFAGDIDLLVLDGDKNWLWDALTVVTPRVVVIDFQDILGPDLSLTVPYADDFSAFGYPMTSDFRPNFGGVAAGAHHASQRRYRLVAVNRAGYNAFFIRDALGRSLLPTLDVTDAFDPRVNADRSERFATCRGSRPERKSACRTRQGSLA